MTFRRRPDILVSGFLLVLIPTFSFAQDVPPPRKQARAVRVAAGSIRLDGRLHDEAWRLAEPVVDFVQKEPVEGTEPTERTEIRFAFDDTALCVGALNLEP